MSVIRRLQQGITANVFGQIINLVIQLASVPLLLGAWGAAGMGEWLLVSSIPNYLVAGDLGLSAATANLMVMAVVAGDRAAAQRLFQTSLVALAALGPLLLLPLLALALALPLRQWFGLALLDEGTVDIVLVLLVLRMWLVLLAGGLIVAFRCDGYYAIGNHLSNLVRLTEFIIMALVLLAGGGMLAVAGVMVAVQAVGLLVLAVGLRRCSPWLAIGWRNADRESLRQMARPALSFVGFPLAAACNQQAPLMIAGMLLGPSAAAALATGRTLARLAQLATSIIGTSTWPEMSRAFGEKAMARVRIINRTAVKAGLWLGLVALAGLWLLGPFAYHLWTGNQIVLDQTMFLLLLLAGLVNGLWSMALVVLTASNRHGGAAGLTLVVSLLVVPACYAGAWLAGLAGIAAALLFCELLLAVPVIRASLRESGDDLPGFLAALADPLALYHLWRDRRG